MNEMQQLTKFDGGMALTTLTPEQAIQRHQMLIAFVKSSLVEGRDYGVIPGTDKRSLWKPGAEKLCTLFGFSTRLVPSDIVRDWTGKEHGDEPFFFYEYRCEITHGAVMVTESYGSCNSFEKKYRWREGKRTCPKCGKESVYRSKPRNDDPPNKPMGWYCWTKKGGCGAQFPANDAAITSQKIGLVKNDEVFDLVNTVDKMAQKRALVGSTVIACNASEFFSDKFDEEDFVEGSLTISPIIVEDSPEVIRARTQAGSKALYGDEGDLDLGPTWTKEPTAAPAVKPNGDGQKPQATTESPKQPAADWPVTILMKLGSEYKKGTPEVKKVVILSKEIKPTDKLETLQHWYSIYRNQKDNEKCDTAEAVRRADADRQATRESA